MIFPLIEAEPIVQVGDKTRISGVKTFKSIDESAITKVEIEPETGAGFIDVSGAAPLNSKNWFLDWSYSTDGNKTATIRVTTNGAPSTLTKTIVVISAENDKLWSDDSDLIVHEPDIMGWTKPGRSSFINYHRMAQKRILEWLDNLKVWDKNGNPITKNDIDSVMAAEDLKRISMYWTLELIFGGLSNKTDDVFSAKEKQYRAMRKETQGDRSRIRYDWNKNSVVENFEQVRLGAIRMRR